MVRISRRPSCGMPAEHHSWRQERQSGSPSSTDKLSEYSKTYPVSVPPLHQLSHAHKSSVAPNAPLSEDVSLHASSMHVPARALKLCTNLHLVKCTCVPRQPLPPASSRDRLAARHGNLHGNMQMSVYLERLLRRPKLVHLLLEGPTR